MLIYVSVCVRLYTYTSVIYQCSFCVLTYVLFSACVRMCCMYCECVSVCIVHITHDGAMFCDVCV